MRQMEAATASAASRVVTVRKLVPAIASARIAPRYASVRTVASAITSLGNATVRQDLPDHFAWNHVPRERMELNVNRSAAARTVERAIR